MNGYAPPSARPQRRTARAGEPGKYVPLVAWLQRLPAEQTSEQLTFAEIETLIGGALPSSAWSTAYWTHSTTAMRYWRSAGFRAQLYRREQRVLFTRKES